LGVYKGFSGILLEEGNWLLEYGLERPEIMFLYDISKSFFVNGFSFCKSLLQLIF
jgi:hypothetical protein